MDEWMQLFMSVCCVPISTEHTRFRFIFTTGSMGITTLNPSGRKSELRGKWPPSEQRPGRKTESIYRRVILRTIQPPSLKQLTLIWGLHFLSLHVLGHILSIFNPTFENKQQQRSRPFYTQQERKTVDNPLNHNLKEIQVE
ncbi:Wd Repeat-Containing Protein 43 [Manis pentadactyla]|nr:Wd Repeat-Containing Protein 43 [Manis pentadactyla]